MKTGEWNFELEYGDYLLIGTIVQIAIEWDTEEQIPTKFVCDFTKLDVFTWSEVADDYIPMDDGEIWNKENREKVLAFVEEQWQDFALEQCENRE